MSVVRRAFSLLRTVALIAVATLAIDFVVTLFIPATLLDSFLLARNRDREFYDDTVAWHHDLRPNVQAERVWGMARYPYRSDENGFRTGDCASEPLVPGKTIFLIGDSFIEGLGVPFEQTVAGRLACAWKAQGFTMRSLGVSSFSPITYPKKIPVIAERLKVKPSEVVVFLDICDIYDETTYFEEQDGRLRSRDRETHHKFITWLRHNFTTLGVLNEVRLRMQLANAKPRDVTGRECAQWTLSEEARRKWGNEGLRRASANLEKLAGICRDWNCRMSLVVYPWPDQVAAKDRESLQVTYWRDWSKKNGVRFVDAFGPFFNAPPAESINRYYIPGDVHYNAEGNRILFDEVWKTLGQP